MEILIVFGIPAIILLGILIGIYLLLERRTSLSRKWRWLIMLLTIPAISLVGQLVIFVIQQSMPKLERIQVAVVEGDVKKIEQFLEDDPTLVDFRTEQGHTLLWDAALLGHESVAKVLVDCGIDLNTSDQLGDTALHFAARLGEASMAAILVESGAEINPLDKEGRTPLDLALGEYPSRSPLMEYGRSKVAELLITNRGQMSDGIQISPTALHWAAAGDHRRTVKFLLENGASAAVRDNGKTPLEISRENGNEEIAVMLEGLEVKLE